MSKRHVRTLARRMAVQALYTSEITKVSLESMLAGDIELPDEGVLPEYARYLLQGVADHSQDIDAALAEVSKNWAVERMPMVDYAILRMATYEMLYEDAIPVSVCINEAVELAKGFGGQDDSARFANGILGQIARTYIPERCEGAVDEGQVNGQADIQSDNQVDIQSDSTFEDQSSSIQKDMKEED